jgi:hypothetical protein
MVAHTCNPSNPEFLGQSRLHSKIVSKKKPNKIKNKNSHLRFWQFTMIPPQPNLCSNYIREMLKRTIS